MFFDVLYYKQVLVEDIHGICIHTFYHSITQNLSYSVVFKNTFLANNNSNNFLYKTYRKL